MKKMVLLLMFSLYGWYAFGQLSGVVLNADTQEPVPGASVFINNSSIGTVSDKAGNFFLPHLPTGSQSLIISSIGYHLIAIDVATLTAQKIKVLLQPKIQELENVTVEPHQKETWEKWGKLFEEYFLGQSEFSETCKIVNKKKIEFRYYKKSNRLEVLCEEPILIENKALGYHIEYNLENFNISFSEKLTTHSGYVYFADFKRVRNKHQKNREKAYLGSKMHFFRSLYEKQLGTAGFILQKMVREYNLEKQRITPLYRKRLQEEAKKGPVNLSNIPETDSLSYYQKVMQKKDYKDHYLHPLTEDSLLLTTAEQRYLFFSDYVFITYKKAAEEKKYLQFHGENRTPGFQRSLITLLQKEAMLLTPDGNYANPENLISTSYWSWRENMSTMLPLNYDLANKK